MRSDPLADRAQLGLAFEVVVAVARQDVVEQVVSPGDRPRDSLVRCGREDDPAVVGLLLEELKEVGVEGNGLRIPCRALEDALLEGRPAAEQPARELQQRHRGPLDYADDAFPKRVGQREGAIEIDDQGRGGRATVHTRSVH